MVTADFTTAFPSDANFGLVYDSSAHEPDFDPHDPLPPGKFYIKETYGSYLSSDARGNIYFRLDTERKDTDPLDRSPEYKVRSRAKIANQKNFPTVESIDEDPFTVTNGRYEGVTGYDIFNNPIYGQIPYYSKAWDNSTDILLDKNRKAWLEWKAAILNIGGSNLNESLELELSTSRFPAKDALIGTYYNNRKATVLYDLVKSDKLILYEVDRGLTPISEGQDTVESIESELKSKKTRDKSRPLVATRSEIRTVYPPNEEMYQVIRDTEEEIEVILPLPEQPFKLYRTNPDRYNVYIHSVVVTKKSMEAA
jgi:hypothetical protein